ncbi:MAG TPA: FAD:protein FMN transferase [Actinomycetota bacterium]|jgi:thiamine biosynthesis lipoprotein|nr:FAD:protein FMN transferase [Actinomycetota bacterium]
MAAETRFRAMGSDVHVIVVRGSRALLWAAADRLEDLEARWSRFRPTSEVSLMNAMAGRPVRVSGPTLELVLRSLEGARRTGGRFDPSVLGDVIRAGYDRSFETLPDDPPPGRSTLRSGYPGIVVDVASRTVRLPEGVGFDPGGIGKGLAADLLAAELSAAGAVGVCANVGGDLRVEGPAPGGGSWPVAIEHPWGGPAITVSLRAGAVATSTRARRVLGSGHHLIDPATGRSAQTGIASATAVAAEAWQAEVLAKAAFLGGDPAWGGAEWLVVEDSGRIRTSPGFSRFVVPMPHGKPGSEPPDGRLAG